MIIFVHRLLTSHQQLFAWLVCLAFILLYCKVIFYSGIDFHEDSFIWEDVKLSDGCLSQTFSQPESESISQPVPKQEATSPPAFYGNYDNIPNIDILQTAINQIPTSPYASECSETESDSIRYNANPLLAEYGIDDDSLSDMSLKKLKELCKGDGDHFNQLKAYRRTCLNRHYARSSRAKTQKKTACMSTELASAKQTISRLTKENTDQAATIKYLQLELQILRSMNK